MPMSFSENISRRAAYDHTKLNGIHTMQKMIFTTDEVAKMLNVNKSTVKRWANEGKIRCDRTPGHHRKFSKDDVLEFSNNNHYRIEKVHKELSMDDDALIMKQLITDNNGSAFRSVIFSFSLKRDQHEMMNIMQKLYDEKLTYKAIVRDFILPVMAKLDRIESTGKIDGNRCLVAKRTIGNSMVTFSDRVQRTKRRSSVAVIFSFDASLENDLKIVESKLEVDGYLVINLGPQYSWTTVNQWIGKNDSNVLLCLVKHSHNHNPHVNDIAALERISDDRAMLFLCGTTETLIEIDLEYVGKMYRTKQMDEQE
jgi:excisionase family DNA binding protein